MPTEIIIGKEGTQKFAIKSDSVSRQHAKLTVMDNGQLLLEDLNSTNGTFVSDGNGNFQRISKVYVQRDTIVRLGLAGVHSFTFWVNHLLVENPTDFSFEFKQLIRRHKSEFVAQQEQLMKKNDMREWAGIAAPLIGLGLSFAFANDPLMIRLAITIPSMAVGLLFMGFGKKLRALISRRQRTIVCPNCGRPLSDYDIEQQQCSACKAHS